MFFLYKYVMQACDNLQNVRINHSGFNSSSFLFKCQALNTELVSEETEDSEHG